ncbi:GtrA family protein [Alicyclobacillaceae bacterium I2511]|nr:GtrA family protein [Alicyclobacillaceae bacterium I2511]
MDKAMDKPSLTEIPLSLWGLFFRGTRRYVKFLVVGGINVVLDVGIFNLFLWLLPTRTAWALTIYNTIAVVIAILNGYVWNRRWTFRDLSTGSSRERWLYLIQAGLNLALNDLIVVWVSTYLRFAKSVPYFISSNAGKGAAMLLSSLMSFVIIRLVVYRNVKSPPPHES